MAERSGGDSAVERGRGHEASDVQIRPLLRVAAAVAVLAVVIHLLLYGVFKLYEKEEERGDPARIRSAVREDAPLPPEPRLQPMPGLHPNLPSEDLAEMRRQEEELLQSYGPTSEEGVVHIPIGRAMDLLLEKGLPGGRGKGEGK